MLNAYLSPRDNRSRMDHARRLTRMRIIRPSAFRIYDALLWEFRRQPWQDRVVASWTQLQEATGLARETVQKGLAQLLACGLLCARDRHTLVPWRRGGMKRMRLSNEYTLLPPADCESAPRPRNLERSILQEISLARAALPGRFGPCEPVRTVAEQIAILSGTA